MPREATASSKEARLVTSHLFLYCGRNRDRMDDYFVKVFFKSSQPVGVDTGPRPGTALRRQPLLLKRGAYVTHWDG